MFPGPERRQWIQSAILTNSLLSSQSPQKLVSNYNIDGNSSLQKQDLTIHIVLGNWGVD